MSRRRALLGAIAAAFAMTALLLSAIGSGPAETGVSLSPVLGRGPVPIASVMSGCAGASTFASRAGAPSTG